MKCSLDISNFLEEISSLSHSIVFLYFFALITEEGFCISPCYYMELCIQMEYLSFSPLLFTSLLSQLFVLTNTQIQIYKYTNTELFVSSDSHFALFISFSWGWSWSLSPVQCHKPLSIVILCFYHTDIITLIMVWFLHIFMLTHHIMSNLLGRITFIYFSTRFFYFNIWLMVRVQ